MAAIKERTDLTEVGNELRVVLGRIVRRLRQSASQSASQSHEPTEITLSELSVLSRLDSGGSQNAGALADQERISPQAMSAIVTTLEQRGLVTRIADIDDGRRTSLSATAAGRTLLAGRRSLTAQRVAGALRSGLSPKEREQLIAAIPLLERLAEHL
jgi:DNA-binding MarR family transcriptional regulator